MFNKPCHRSIVAINPRVPSIARISGMDGVPVKKRK
jgi:hypothetical protein